MDNSINSIQKFIDTYNENISKNNYKEAVKEFEDNHQEWKKVVGYVFGTLDGSKEYGRALIIYTVAVSEIESLNQKKLENLLAEIVEYENNGNTKFFFGIKNILYLNLGLCWHKLGQIYNIRAIEAFKKYIFYLLTLSNNTSYNGINCYAFRSCSKHLLSSLINETLNLSSPKTFNDIFDPPIFLLIKLYGDEPAQLIREAYEQSVKMACFVKNEPLPIIMNGKTKNSKSRSKKEFLNELMWSHYGDSHKGICIKYRFPLNITSSGSSGKEYISYFKDIEYVPNLEGLTQNNNINMDKAFFAKSKTWQYENELRFLYCNPNNNDTYTSISIPNAIEAVYFGVQCSEIDKNTIQNILSDKKCNFYKWERGNNEIINKKIVFYQMAIDEKKFGKLKAIKI